MHQHISRLFFFLIGFAALLTAGLWQQMSPDHAVAGRREKVNAPVTDLVADSIEIIQSMQDLNNSVPLVEAKRTFVRFYVHSTNGVYPATAILTAESEVLSQTLLPISPGGPLINVRPTYNRADALACPFIRTAPVGHLC